MSSILTSLPRWIAWDAVLDNPEISVSVHVYCHDYSQSVTQDTSGGSLWVEVYGLVSGARRTCSTTHNQPLATGPAHSSHLRSPWSIQALLPSRRWKLFKYTEAFPVLSGIHLLLASRQSTSGWRPCPETKRHSKLSSAGDSNLRSVACKSRRLSLSHDALQSNRAAKRRAMQSPLYREPWYAISLNVWLLTEFEGMSHGCAWHLLNWFAFCYCTGAFLQWERTAPTSAGLPYLVDPSRQISLKSVPPTFLYCDNFQRRVHLLRCNFVILNTARTPHYRLQWHHFIGFKDITLEASRTPFYIDYDTNWWHHPEICMV